MKLPTNFVIKTLYTLIFLFASKYNSQAYTISELDSITRRYKNTGNLEDAMKFNIKVLNHYKEQKNAEGTVASYINIGNLLCTLNRYKESMSYLDKAQKEIKNIKNPTLQSRLYSEYGRNYALLGLFKQSNIVFNKAIKQVWKISDKKERNYYLYYNYAWKWDNFENLNETDSMYYMQKKCLEVSSEPLIFVRIADQYVIRKTHLDSAEHYLNKALASTEKYPIHQKAMALLVFGNLYKEKKQYEKALEYYFQSLEISQKMKSVNDTKNVYKAISETYNLLNNTEKATEFFSKYAVLNQDINNDEKKALNIAVDKFLQEKEEEKEKGKNKLYILVFTIILVFLILGYYIRKVYQKKQKQSKRLIKEKALEANKLKMQINASFDEVTQLAKTNDPFFLTRFKEVYVDFYENLVSKYPNLTDHDLKYCAYLKLDISSKEIAQYDNITLRTVETKKYRLKKKLELSSETDLKKWILDL